MSQEAAAVLRRALREVAAKLRVDDPDQLYDLVCDALLETAPQVRAQMDEWTRGALMAVSVQLALHGDTVAAADTLVNLGLTKADCSALDEFDRATLQQLHIEARVSLRGLDGPLRENTAELPPDNAPAAQDTTPGVSAS